MNGNIPIYLDRLAPMIDRMIDLERRFEDTAIELAHAKSISEPLPTRLPEVTRGATMESSLARLLSNLGGPLRDNSDFELIVPSRSDK